MSLATDFARYRRNMQDEIDGAAVYRAMAEREARPELVKIFTRLAEAEERHAGFWEDRLRRAGQRVPARRPSLRSRVMVWLARRFGASFVVPVVASMESMARATYDAQPEAQGTGMAQQERSHARLLGVIAGSSQQSGIEGGALARLEGRHRGVGANALRAAVLGANDGLLSNLSLVMGVAGAALDNHAILVTGMAGLLAGAFSMAVGEWVSVQSGRELNQRQLDVEKDEIAEAPEEEAEELQLIYESKGVPREEARGLAKHMLSDKTTAIDALAREELGIDPNELGGSPWTAAFTSFSLFALGAAVPVVPFALLSGSAAIATSIGLSAVSLFFIGAAITLLTGRSILFSGGRQLVFGLVAAAVTFGAGRLVGGHVG